MNTDTINFLEALRFNANDDDIAGTMLQGKTVHDFAPAFVAAVGKFVSAFRAHLETTGFDMGKLDNMERSFGANVYFSLSGAGCGFFDDNDEEIAALQETLTTWAGAYRFEDLASNLDVGEDGKIDLSFIPSAIEEYREKYFGVPKGETTPPPVKHTPGPLEAILAITKAGVIHRNETGKPQWSALDEIAKLAHEAQDINASLLQSLERVLNLAIGHAADAGHDRTHIEKCSWVTTARATIRKAKGGQ
jgi:hypothetical protein